MAKQTVKLPSFQSVVKGATATCSLPIGATYDQLILSFSGFALADVEEIRLVGNGRPMQTYRTTPTFSGGQLLDEINKYEGRAASANGIIVMDFERYGIRTRISQEITSIGTGMAPSHADYAALGGLGTELESLTLEIDLKSTITGTPRISARAVQSPPRPLGLYKKLLTFYHTVPAESIYEVANVDTGELINKMFVITDKVKNLKLEVDRRIIFDRLAGENTLIQADGVRNPSNKMYVFDPSESGNGSEAIPTKGVQDFRFAFDVSDATDLPLVVEYLGEMKR